MNHHAVQYDGVLGQITGTFSASNPNSVIREKWHRNMGFCRAALISPLNGDALVVDVTGCSVAVLGETSAGVAAAEAMKKFCLGAPLPRGIHSSYFRHWRLMNVFPQPGGTVGYPTQPRLTRRAVCTCPQIRYSAGKGTGLTDLVNHSLKIVI